MRPPPRFVPALFWLPGAAACAPSPPPLPPDPLIVEQVIVWSWQGNPDLPDGPTLRRALLDPILAGCDALVCEHYRPRLFDVRGLACRRVPDRSGRGEEQAECAYQRRPTARPGEPEREWLDAQTTLARRPDGSGWHALIDSPRED